MSSRVSRDRKKMANGILFFLVMGLTFYTFFRGQDLTKIWEAMARLSIAGLGIAILTGLFFVSAEGIMIHYLLKGMAFENTPAHGRSSLWRCISYSFIGFFYSGITPSATGGQPMQLYYMKKDGNRLSDSSVVLMTVALIYKLVLVIIGIGTLVFWNTPLKYYLRGYYGLFLLGLALNTTLVAALLAVMFAPKWMKKIIRGVESLLIMAKIFKKSEKRREKINRFVDGYQNAVQFLWRHKGKIFVVTGFTFLQRFSVFFLAYVVYRGFSLSGAGMATVVLLQASVYIAVDMLPVPGSQGITELMYRSIFREIFTGAYLMPSLYVTRGISFYFLLLVSLAIVIWNRRGQASENNRQAGVQIK